MRKFILPLLLALSLCGCVTGRGLGGRSSTTERSTDQAGQKYQKTLVAMIQRSDKIVVTEHSCEWDTYKTDAFRSLIPKEIVYRTRVLSAAQKASFLSIIEGLNPETKTEYSSCIFEGHHTIQFYSAGRSISTMDICFKCGDVIWPATKVTPPADLISGLAKFIEGIGLSPTRNWPALARRHL
jgi:hypothetical protein